MSYGEPKPVSQSASGKAIASLVLGIASFCLMFITGLPAILLGALALMDISRSGGKRGGTGLAIAGIVLGVIGTMWTCIGVALLLPAVQAAREAARRMESSNNLRLIGIAMHQYHDTYKAFPLTGSNDPEHGVQLSWRVRILPFLEQSPLHDQFDYNEAWDGPSNLPLLDSMPDVFRSPNMPAGDSKTIYLAVVAPDNIDLRDSAVRADLPMFFGDPPQSTSIRDVIDGTSYVIMIVEADMDQAVPWTKPDDWIFDPLNPRRGLGNLRPMGFLALFADGSVHFIGADLNDQTVRYLLSRTDGNSVEF
jgi:hypothetical protein